MLICFNELVLWTFALPFYLEQVLSRPACLVSPFPEKEANQQQDQYHYTQHHGHNNGGNVNTYRKFTSKLTSQ